MPVLNKVNVSGIEYDLIGLGGDVLPIGSEIDIASTATIPAGWEEVSNKYEIYDTTERCIGRWIDGKPLYRKVLQFNNKMISNIESVSQLVHNIMNIDFGIVKEAYYDFGTGNWCKGENVVNEKNEKYGASYILGDTVIYMRDSALSFDASVNRSWLFIVEYTKTIDTANTPITKRIKKVTQVTPPALGDNYSTEEQVVGTWIDGKPIYRKAIYVASSISANEEKRKNCGIDNLEKAIKLYGFCNWSPNSNAIFNFPIPYLSIDLGQKIQVFYQNNGEVGVGTSIAIQNVYVILEYTKTTDTIGGAE